MKAALAFAAVASVLILGAAWGVTLLRPEPEVARAVWSSAAIALAVQAIAFALARPFVATNPIAGWGLGSLLRFAVVAVHALVGVQALALQSAPALLSLVGFLFITMLVEPLFLKQ